MLRLLIALRPPRIKAHRLLDSTDHFVETG